MNNQSSSPLSAGIFNLQRFLDAQAPLYHKVVTELSAGDKKSHWMWFIFPQVAGLGNSEMAKRYAITSLEEATAYLQHPILSNRLLECASLVMQVNGKTAHQVLGSPDDQKLQSCMSLFSLAGPEHPVFSAVLEKFYRGKKDQRTLALLGVQ